MTTTTRRPTRPTMPTRFCKLERLNKDVIHFPVGTSRRLYQDDDPDCSELCKCGVGEVVTCSISDCAARKPCETTAAIYSHASTAFQAYRGECLCFSGSFVCARPEPGMYSLPSGVFLFMGYSKTDEQSMHHFTNLNVSKHLLTAIQRVLQQSETWVDPELECRISIHDQIDENVILQIRLAALDFQRANESITLDMLLNEKAQCLTTATRLRLMVNARSPEIKEDEILSIVKVADATSVLPEPQKASMGARPIASIVLIFTLLIGGHVLHDR